MGLLGLGIRTALDRAHIRKSKKQLEAKLGRKVSENELYSLNANLAAADNQGAIATPYSQPWDSTPKVNGKTKKIVLLSVIGLVLLSLPVLWVMNMSEYKWNKINPFAPKPPAGAFPAQIGNFKRAYEVDYSRFNNIGDGKYFSSSYQAGNEYAKYALWNFPTADAARQAFLSLKAEAESKRSSAVKITSLGESRFLKIGGVEYVSTYWLNGAVLRQVSGRNGGFVIDFDAQLTGQTPFPKDEAVKATATAKPTVTITKLLADYRSNSKTADVFYKGQTMVITGVVAVAEKSKQGKPVVGFTNPGESASDGMVICTFEPSDELMAAKIKQGETVSLSARIFGKMLNNVMLENCTKP